MCRDVSAALTAWSELAVANGAVLLIAAGDSSGGFTFLTPPPPSGLSLSLALYFLLYFLFDLPLALRVFSKRAPSSSFACSQERFSVVPAER